MPLSAQYEQPLLVPEPTAHGITWLAIATGTNDSRAVTRTAGEYLDRDIMEKREKA